jgi:hypothetical protein
MEGWPYLNTSTNAEDDREPLDECAKVAYEKWRETQNPDTTYLPPWDDMQNPSNRQWWYSMADAIIDTYLGIIHG